MEKDGFRVTRLFDAEIGKTLVRIDWVTEDGQHFFAAAKTEDIDKLLISIKEHPTFNDKKIKLEKVNGLT